MTDSDLFVCHSNHIYTYYIATELQNAHSWMQGHLSWGMILTKKYIPRYRPNVQVRISWVSWMFSCLQAWRKVLWEMLALMLLYHLCVPNMMILFCCPHYLLQGLAVDCIAIPIPDDVSWPAVRTLSTMWWKNDVKTQSGSLACFRAEFFTQVCFSSKTRRGCWWCQGIWCYSLSCEAIDPYLYQLTSCWSQQSALVLLTLRERLLSTHQPNSSNSSL